MEHKQLYIHSDIEMKAGDEDRVIEFIASKEVVDRSGDVVKIAGMDLKDFKRNPVIMWSHQHDTPPIGKAVSMRKTGDELRMKVLFASADEYGFADTIYRLARGGYVSATSIGIIPDYDSMEYPDNKKLNGKPIKRIINKSSLFELSVVPIPMNQDALTTGKILQKAIDDGVIDEVEMKEFELLSKDAEPDSEPEVDEPITDEVAVLKSRIAELELLVKEQEMEAELEDDIYAELYDEFVDKSSDEKDKGCKDILDEYL